MDASARRALKAIRRCVREGRYAFLPHFRLRMAQRGILWPDLCVILEEPTDVRDGGPEIQRRPKWVVTGTAVDGRPLELVCVLSRDDRGVVTLFVTAHWDV